MSRQCGDLLKASRKRAGLLRDPAAEELHIAVRTLDSYESTSEDNEPDMEMIRQMCILYKDPDLARQYIKRSALGEFFPDIQPNQSNTFQGSALNVLDSMNRVNDKIRDLIAISADGVVQEAEQNRWSVICHDMNDLIQSVTMLLTVKKGEK